MRHLDTILQTLTLVIVGAYTFLTYRLLSLQTRQGFENKFFQLLRFHHEIVHAIRVPPLPGGPASHPSEASVGRPAFGVLYERLIEEYDAAHKKYPEASANRLAENAYDSLFEKYQDPLGHYFRNLYHLIKFIDKSDQAANDKNFYAHLVRAQLSSHELLLLFYNGYSRYGKPKFYPLIESYSLLENMPDDQLISRRLGLPGNDRELYRPKAFGPA